MQISTMNVNDIHVNASRDKTTRSMKRRMKRQRYKPNDQTVGTNFRECVESFKKSREYMKLEKCAKTLAFDAVEQPDWEGEIMLGKTMQCTCTFFQDTDSLDTAQEFLKSWLDKNIHNFKQ